MTREAETKERSSWAELREDPALYVRNRPQAVLIPLVFVLFVTLWEWVVRAWNVPNFLVPAPSTVAGAPGRGVRAGLYLTQLWVPLLEALVGVVLPGGGGLRPGGHL